jgi:hypothetical protein
VSKRSTHCFAFMGSAIAKAATAEAEYHEQRLAYWKAEYESAVAKAKAAESAVAKAKAAGLQVREYDVTGGKRAEMVIDPALQGRIRESTNKVHSHRIAAEHLRVEASSYATQGDRQYELDGEDVVYFRLAGGPRGE